MGLFSSLMGKDSARAATALGERNRGQLTSSYGQANDYAKQGYDTQMGFYKPYAEGGQRAQTAYDNTLGLNGQAARDRQFQEGYVNDPAGAYRTQQTQNQIAQLYRKYNASPSGVNSGAAMYGAGRLTMDRFDKDWGDYQNRLLQLGQQGLGVANAQAGAAGNYYGGMADRSIGLGNALVSNDTNATMAANKARQQGINNMMAIAGGMGQMAMGMPPTSFGNVGKSSGGNSAWFNPDTNQLWSSSSMPNGGYAPDPRLPWG